MAGYVLTAFLIGAVVGLIVYACCGALIKGVWTTRDRQVVREDCFFLAGAVMGIIVGITQSGELLLFMFGFYVLLISIRLIVWIRARACE